MPDGKKSIIVPVKAGSTPVPDRINVFLQVVHEQDGTVPQPTQCNFSNLLKLKDTPTFKRIQVGSLVNLIGFRWFDPDSAGLIVVENTVGRGLTKKPTEEEKAAMDEQSIILRTSLESVGQIIRPGDFRVLKDLEDYTRIVLMCKSGVATANVTVYPR
jgi:hypothetical protein